MTNQNNIPDMFYTLQEAADYMHIKRQAVYEALKKGKLISRRVKRNHIFTRQELDDYRANKFNRDYRVPEDKKIFDLEKGFLSATHVSKTISAMLRRSFPLQHVYYLLRTGQLKGSKKGASWVVAMEDAKALVESHPFLSDHSGKFSVEIYELMPVPKM